MGAIGVFMELYTEYIRIFWGLYWSEASTD